MTGHIGGWSLLRLSEFAYFISSAIWQCVACFGRSERAGCPAIRNRGRAQPIFEASDCLRAGMRTKLRIVRRRIPWRHVRLAQPAFVLLVGPRAPRFVG